MQTRRIVAESLNKYLHNFNFDDIELPIFFAICNIPYNVLISNRTDHFTEIDKIEWIINRKNQLAHNQSNVEQTEKTPLALNDSADGFLFFVPLRSSAR